jgi:hypothetical protein
MEFEHPIEVGYYQAIVTDVYECDWPTSKLPIHALSVSEIGLEGPDIYPNPFGDYIQIDSEERILFWTIYSSTGQQVAKSQTEGFRISIPTSNLPTGVYFLESQSEKSTSRSILVKE